MAKKTAKANTVSTVSTKETGKKKEISGTKDSPWTLTTPSGQSEYQAYRDGRLIRQHWLCWSEKRSSDII